MVEETKKTKASGSIWPLLFLLALIIGFSLLGYFRGGSEKVAGELDKGDIEEIIADYIQNHPEEILESVQNMQAKKTTEDQARAKKSVSEKIEELERDSDAPTLGNLDGDVTVVEFFDYNCGFCKRVQPAIVKLIEEDSNVRVVMKELPILSPVSEIAARAALAVHKIAPEKYQDVHNALMKARLANEASILNLIKKEGIDVEAVKEKMKEDEISDLISKNQKLAETIGINGTPAFVIGGKLIPGAISYGQMTNAIKEAREK